jgi:hypothetical protein
VHPGDQLGRASCNSRDGRWVTDHVWDVADVVKLLDDKPERPNYETEAHYGPALGHDPLGKHR